jgi:hypothetical protein
MTSISLTTSSSVSDIKCDGDITGIWIVRAFNGRNLIPLDIGNSSDPYIKAGLLIGQSGPKRKMEKMLRGPSVSSSLNPNWNGWTYNVGGTTLIPSCSHWTSY